MISLPGYYINTSGFLLNADCWYPSVSLSSWQFWTLQWSFQFFITPTIQSIYHVTCFKSFLHYRPKCHTYRQILPILYSNNIFGFSLKTFKKSYFHCYVIAPLHHSSKIAFSLSGKENGLLLMFNMIHRQCRKQKIFPLLQWVYYLWTE